MQQQERRRYFRIDDEIILAWKTLSGEEKNRQVEQFKLGGMEYPDIGRWYLSLESDINSLIQTLTPQNPHVAQAIQLLNRKMNLIARGGPFSETQRTLLEEVPQPVNISACGIAFMAESAVQLGMDLQIEMVLLPEKIYILTHGVVVGCDNMEGALMPYRINVDFVLIREDDREKLIQHVMQKEMEILRLRRRQGGDRH